MLYISYWWILIAIVLYAIYFIFGCISIGCIMIYSIILKKKVNKIYDGKTNKFILALNNFSTYFRNICIVLLILSAIIIPVNNLFYNIKIKDKNEQLNFIRNEQFINKVNYTHFYKVVAINNDKLDDCCNIYKYYYVSSVEPIEKIQEHKFIKVNKVLYIKPVVINEISKNQFLEKTKTISFEDIY